jgi:parallel beta-helix repeat protein
MRRKKTAARIVATVLLALFLVVAISGVALAFPDVPASHPYATAVTGLSSLGIIGGYTNGYFGINDSVKRAQFTKMIVGTLNITPNASTATRFLDLGEPDVIGYPHRFVQTAYDGGITFGTNAAQTLFGPYNAIRRDQVVSMIVRGANNLYPGSLIAPPAGFPSYFAGVPEPHGGNLRIAEYNGLLDGLMGMGSGWSVSASASRGEVAQMLYNLLGVLEPSGVWVYADGSGDYPTIAAAMANVDTGETIYLGPGVFGLTGTLYADFSFNLVGSGIDETVITYSKDVIGVIGPVDFVAQDIAFVCTATSTAADVMYINDATVDVTRCSFSGGNRASGMYGNGLNAYAGADVTATDCIFEKNEWDGIVASDNAYVDVYNSVMDSNGDNGIAFWDGASGIVDYCDSTNNAWHGISVNDSSEVTVQNSDASGNGSGGEFESGMYFDGNAVGNLQNCVANSNSVDGVACFGYAQVMIAHVTCDHNAVDGVAFGESSSGIISYCVCSNSGYNGIAVWENAYVEVDHSLCAGNYDAGIWFGDNATGTITNNECHSNYWGLLIDLITYPTVGAGNYLHNNDVNYRDDMVWTSAAASAHQR